MEEGKDYVIKDKFAVIIEMLSLYGVTQRIAAICDTKEIAELIKDELVKDDRIKGLGIFTTPILFGEKPEIKERTNND